MCAPTPSQYAGIEVLRNEKRDDDISIMRDAYDKDDSYGKWLQNMGLECFEPKGAFMFF